MLRRTLHLTGVVLTLTLVVTAGCTGGNNGLPDTITVELPDGSEVETTLGSGVISFADSSWQFFRAVDGKTQGAAFVTVVFGSNGELVALEDSTLAAAIFGSEILFDGERHDTTQPSLTYAAATYGAQTADAQGFAFEGLLSAFAPVLGQVAEGTASASGTYDGDDIDTVLGTFDFVSDVLVETFGLIPEAYMHVEESIDFIGRRVIE